LRWLSLNSALLLISTSQEGAYLISVKNPNRQPSGGGAGRLPDFHDKPTYPPELQEKFQGVRVEQRQWVAVDPPDFLNYPHTQLLLIGRVRDDAFSLALTRVYSLCNQLAESYKSTIQYLIN